MKRLVILLVAVMVTTASFAQKDSTNYNTDTVRVGNFVIIKKNKGAAETQTSVWHDWDKTVDVKIERRPRKKSNVSTNWWIMDLGFANFRDQTNYGYAQAGSYFKTLRPQDGAVNQNSYQLNTGKSSNVNIWLFMQKLNVYKHVVNLKYGLGYEMYNFRYDSRLSYRKDPTAYAYNDSISFSKNKLYVSYITVPFMVNFNTSPDRRNGFNCSIGMSAGYLIDSRNKQISGERGKQKINGDFSFEPWRLATIGEIGLGPIRLYGSYSLNKLQKDITRVEQYPYSVGIRFSRW
ncbi:MAG: hypothetical protein WCH78_14720 [Bacteroidota bacterium]